MKPQTVLSAAFLFVLAAVYGIWAFAATTALNLASAIASAGLCVLFGWCGVYCIKLVLASWSGEAEYDPKAGLGRRSLRPGVRHPVLKICLALLLSRLAVYVIAYLFSIWQSGYSGGLLNTMSLWLKGDAPHYLGIAENWYVTEGDPRFHIVFFPFYPALVRIVANSNYFASGLFVSNLAAIAAGYLLYELAMLDMDRAGALRALKFQFLLPAAFLLCAPMSDSLFLLLSVLTLYLLRKGHFISACVIGALSSFTRVQGALLMAPVAVEMIGALLRERAQGARGRRFVLRQAGRFALLLVIPLGLLLYIWINYDVTGNPFQFMIYQKEHWGQNMGWFFNTAAYQTNRLIETTISSPREAYGLWLPNLVFLFGSLMVLLPSLFPQKNDDPEDTFARRPLRASYAVYFLVYYFFSMGATWLLSAPRYLTCAAPLSLALGHITSRRWVNGLLTALFLVLQVLYLYLYVAGYPIY